MSTVIQRPYVPQQFRRHIFDALHNLSNPGIHATQRLVTNRFVLPSINKDIRQWTQSCLRCQQSRVHRHSTAPLGTFVTLDARFDLPPSNGFVYLLTCINQFTRWPEAVPIHDCTADTVAKAFVQIWISRFRVASI